MKRLANLHLQTDEEAELKKLEDEKNVLQAMINRMKKETQEAIFSIDERIHILEKIHHFSKANKLDLLEYYNKLEALSAQMEKCLVSGGDLTLLITDILRYTDKKDDLINAICNDLLSSSNTSSNVITQTRIENYFKAHKEDIYRQCFKRKDKTIFGIFEKSMFYTYYYVFMDRLMFQK